MGPPALRLGRQRPTRAFPRALPMPLPRGRRAPGETEAQGRPVGAVQRAGGGGGLGQDLVFPLAEADRTSGEGECLGGRAANSPRRPSPPIGRRADSWLCRPLATSGVGECPPAARGPVCTGVLLLAGRPSGRDQKVPAPAPPDSERQSNTAPAAQPDLPKGSWTWWGGEAGVSLGMGLRLRRAPHPHRDPQWRGDSLPEVGGRLDPGSFPGSGAAVSGEGEEGDGGLRRAGGSLCPHPDAEGDPAARPPGAVGGGRWKAGVHREQQQQPRRPQSRRTCSCRWGQG